MATQMIPVDPNGRAVSTHVAQIEGVEGFSRSDLRVPVIKIVQGTSKMEDAGRHGGDFYNSITGEFVKELDVVILAEKHSRAKYEHGGSQDRPECVSRDNITGSKFGACKTCRHNAQTHPELWDLPSEDRDERCNLGYYLTLLLVDEGLPATFTAQKTNTNAIRVVNTRTLAKRFPIWGYTWTLSTVRKIEGTNAWYELVAKVKRENTPEERVDYREYAATLRAATIEEVDSDAPPAPASEPPADDAPSYTDADAPAGEEPGTEPF